MAQTYNNEPGILAWYPVNEWDNELDEHSKPHLYSHLLCREFAIKGPDRPGLCLSMGFHGPTTWQTSGRWRRYTVQTVHLHEFGTAERALQGQAKTAGRAAGGIRQEETVSHGAVFMGIWIG